MARPPAPLDGFDGELLLVPALHDGMVGPALVDALERDLGDRLTVQGLEAGHMVYWDAFDKTAALLRSWLAGDERLRPSAPAAGGCQTPLARPWRFVTQPETVVAAP